MNSHYLELKSINFSIGSRKILNNLNFSVKSGSVHGFLGPNGAGKSTTMRVITGVITPQSGEVIINGEQMSVKNYALKDRIGYLPENPPLYDEMTVRQYLYFMGELRGISKIELLTSINGVLKKLQISDIAERLLSNLSRGYRQRVGFAQALIHKPELIILDEPTLGLDPHAIADMRDLISELAGDYTILLSSHQLQEVSKVCDEVTFIRHGEIVLSGKMSELSSQMDSKTQKMRVRAFGVNDSLVTKLKELNYITYVHSTINENNEINSLEIDIDNNEKSKAQLSLDLVRYGCSPVELAPMNNLESYFLQQVKRG